MTKGGEIDVVGWGGEGGSMKNKVTSFNHTFKCILVRFFYPLLLFLCESPSGVMIARGCLMSRQKTRVVGGGGLVYVLIT